MENEAAWVQIGNYVVGRATFSRYVFPFFWFLGPGEGPTPHFHSPLTTYCRCVGQH